MDTILTRAARRIAEGRIPKRHGVLVVLNWIVRRCQRRARRAA